MICLRHKTCRDIAIGAHMSIDWIEMHKAITDELERQHTDDLPDRYVDWIDRDALTDAVMEHVMSRGL